MTAIDRMLSGFPPLNAQGSAEEVLSRYVEAVRDRFDIDIEAGVDIVNRGELPGFTGAFAPTPPQFASAVRIAQDKRAAREARDRALRPALPAPLIEHSAESRAKMADMVAGVVANLKSVTADEDEAASKRRAEMWDRTNRAFEPSLSDREIERRLGFSAGDPEDHEAAA